MDDSHWTYLTTACVILKEAGMEAKMMGRQLDMVEKLIKCINPVTGRFARGGAY